MQLRPAAAWWGGNLSVCADTHTGSIAVVETDTKRLDVFDDKGQRYVVCKSPNFIKHQTVIDLTIFLLHPSYSITVLRILFSFSYLLSVTIIR